jgi:asparagine synthase (glutamine-hydrolysing)
MKPLYIYEDEEVLYFSSEIKAILSLDGVDRSLDQKGFQDYITFRYVHAPNTLFKNIKKLEAGHYVEIKNGTLRKVKYWDIEYNPKLSRSSEAELKTQILDTLDSIIQSQLMGEVPVGVLLSGGLDSSTIAYFIHKNKANLTTFNIGYPEVNEFEYSRFVSEKLGLKHVEVLTTTDEFVNDFDKILLALDEPIGDPACFPLYKLCEELKKHVTVVLSGEGGDEIFCGYPQYLRLVNSGVKNNSSFVDFLKQSQYCVYSRKFFRDEFDAELINRYKMYFDDNSLINGMMGYDLKTWVPEDLMMKADKIMMAHSLEGRFPFLDKRIIQLAANIPEAYKMSAGITKRILKEAMTPFLTKTIVNRQKMGFTVPVPVLLTKMRTRVLDTFFSTDTSNFLSNILDMDSVRSIAADYYSRGQGSPTLVWTMFILLSWFDIVYGRL